MANVIEQIVQPASFGGQTIEITVRSNERGPQGEQGEPGEAATITAGNAYTLDYGEQPRVMNSGTSSDAKFDFYIPEGKPGAVHYTAGSGINITDDNRIEATGEMAVYWGDLVGSMNNQTDLKNALNAKQDKLTAGTNITISSNTISAKEYSAGTGLNLSNNGEFSVDTNVIQPKLTAGPNIQINSNTISATDTTYNNFIGADGGSGGSAGLVPAPVATDNVKVLQGNGTWVSVRTNNISNSAVTTAKINDGSVTTAKINDSAVTTAKINDVAVTADKIDFTTFGFGNYSTSEQDTGFTWVDGKAIYKKTIATLNLPTAGGQNATTAHGISNLQTLVKMDGALVNTSGAHLPLSYGDGNNNDTVTYVDATNVIIYSVSSHAGWTGQVTLYYTKNQKNNYEFRNRAINA